MKRRNIKKQIRRLELELLPLAMKYLQAGQTVHHGVLAEYENNINRILSYVVDCHLSLDHSWPRRERWFDGLGEFVWKKSPSTLSGNGELWWGYRSDIAGAQVKEDCFVMLDMRKPKKLFYQIVIGTEPSNRTFSNRK